MHFLRCLTLATATAIEVCLSLGDLRGHGTDNRCSLRKASVYLRRFRAFAVVCVAVAGFCRSQEARATVSLHAQFVAAQSAVASGSLSYPYRVAVDASGNVYISDTQANEVLKETWSQSTQTYTESVVVSTGLATPYGIAVDSSGNVYIADNGHNRVVKETPSAGSYTQSVVSTTTAVSYPTGLAVDSSGNLYIADTGGGKILKEAPSGSSYTETVLTYSSNFAQITGIAVDSSGDIFVSDIDNDAVYEETYSAGSYTPSTIATSGLSYPYDIAVDASGNLYISDFSNKRIVEETYISAGNYTQSVFPTANLGGVLGLAVDSSGDLYLADTFGFNIKKETLAGGNFEAVQVGSASSMISMLFSFSGGNMGDTLGLTNIATLTQGATGLDFASSGSGSGICSTTATYSEGDSCFVNVTLTPEYPGQRYGAVELLGSVVEPMVARPRNARPENVSGSLLATGYMTGLGIGPQVNFLPFSFSFVFRVAGSFSPYDLTNPFDSVVDPSGNVYVVDYNNNAVYMETLSAGSYTQSTVASGLNNPEALAIDGAGSLYIVDSGNNQILKESWQNGSWVQTTVATSLDFPTGVAVDAFGNVYFSSFSDGAVYELMLSSGSYSLPGTAVTGLNEPRKIAVDASGDLFIADTGNSRVVEEIPNGEGYSQTVIGSGMHYPYGVAVGASGMVYVADTINSRILLETPSGAGFTQTVLIPGPPAYGIAVDGQGNVYFPDPADATVFKVGFSDPPSFSFASTVIGATSSDSPQSTTIVNIGNAALALPAPGSGSNPAVSAGFELDGATTCPEVAASDSAGTLAVNASCVYAIDFAPTTVSSYSGSLTLTDNSLNIASATQSIALTGTGLPLPATQLALSGVPSLLLSGGNLGTVTVDVENMNGVVVTGSSASVTVTVTGPGGYSQMVSGAASSGVYSANLSSLALTVAGTYTVTVTSSELTSASATSIVEPTEIGFSSLPVGTASSTMTVTIPFGLGATLGTPGVKVVTQGATGLDFTNAGTGTCTAGAMIASDSSCTVNVVFTPKYPGIRYGAVILYDGSGNVLETVYLTGTGTGPMVNFLPGTPVLVASNQPPYNLQAPASSQVDASGNIYVADHNNNAVYKETPSGGGYVQTTLPATGLNLPEDAAVDGAGNVYIADSANLRVVELSYTGGSWVQTTILNLNYPGGVAVDAKGNLYVSTVNDGFVYLETLSQGSYTQSTVASGLNQPRKVAVDTSGNVYIADGGNARALKETPNGSGYTQSVIGSGMSLPYGVAVDDNGNVYVSDAGSGTIYTETPSGEGYTQTSFRVGESLAAVTLDAQGNLYVPDRAFEGVAKLDRWDPPTLIFTNTAVNATSSDSPRLVTVENAGNAPLGISVPGSGSNPAISTGFTLGGSTTCAQIASGSSAGSLAANANCAYEVNFSSAIPGPISGTLAITDNQLNIASSTQSISLAGYAYTPLGHYAITGLPLTSVAGVAVPFTLTAESASGAVIPTSYTGTAQLTSSDGQAVFSLTSGGAPITSYTFQNPDAGIKVLYVTFKTAGSQSATATDSAASVTFTSAIDLVTAAAAATLAAPEATSFVTTIGALLGALEVSVADAYGNPVPGVTITYTVPGSGPSAVLTSTTVQTTSAGLTGVAAYANPIAGGPYTMTASSLGLAGSPVSFIGTNLVDGTSTSLATVPGATTVYGNSVTLTATVTPDFPTQPTVVHGKSGKAPIPNLPSGAPAVGPPTGTVSFYDTVGSTTRLLGTSMIDGTSGSSPNLTRARPLAKGAAPIPGTATFSIVAPLGGAHSYTASYGADSNFTASAVNALAYSVTLAPVTVTGPSIQPVAFAEGQSGSIPASVTGPATGTGIVLPSGSVSYTILNSSSTSVRTGTVSLAAASGGSATSVPIPGILAPGSYTVLLSYLGDTNYAASASPVSVSITVSKITPAISWSQPSAINYGTNLSGVLDANAKNGSTTIPGTFAYTATPTGGTASAVTAATVLGAGSYTLGVTFTPTDAIAYTTRSANVSFTVNKGAPTLNWPEPATIAFGTSLNAILNATAKYGSTTLPGVFTYTATSTGGSASTVTASTILAAASYTLSVSFTPTDSADYTTVTGSVILTVSKDTTTILLVSSANPEFVQNAVTFTATVLSSAGTPDGTVSFYDGATLLGSATLTSGIASYLTSSLAIGTHSITAVYSGSSNYSAITSSAVSQAIQDFNLTISTSSGGSSTATTSPGGTATYPLTFSPVDGSKFPAVVHLTVSGLPPGATATLTPDTLPANSGSTNVTLTVNLAGQSASLKHRNPFHDGRLPLAVGLILLPFTGRLRRASRLLRSRRWNRHSQWLLVAILSFGSAASLLVLNGCGGKPTGYFGQAPETYTLTITGTSGSLSHSTTVTLTVE